MRRKPAAGVAPLTLVVALMVALLAGCGDEARDESSPPSPTASPTGSTTAEAPAEGVCRQLPFADIAQGWGMSPTTAEREVIGAAGPGPSYSCSATWWDPDLPLRQAQAVLAVQTYDDPTLAQTAWEDLERRSVDASSVAGDLEVEPVETSPPPGPWDESLAVAAARLLAPGGSRGDEERDQVFLRVWVRAGSTLSDVTVTYEVPADTESRPDAVAAMLDVAEMMLVSAP